MTVTRTVEDKVSDWLTAYNAVAAEMQNEGMLELLGTLQSNEAMRDLPLYIQLARVVNANYRAAATVAALLTQSGIKPTALNFGDDE